MVRPISTLFFLLISIAMSGCTSVKVQSVDASLKLSHVCIEMNPKVIVAGFLPVIQDGFTRHGITTEVYEDKIPEYCRFRLTYTALKKWDVAMYMHHSELRLYDGKLQIGYAQYHLNGGGGFALNKWASVKSKMDPVVDELLAAYTPQLVDKYRTEVPTVQPKQADNQRESLEILKNWHEEGLIDTEEYESEKRRILSEL